ncbi:hypothetical protein K3G39_06340 [Pontibacter sp. HSC-14F20]|nr:hypothetical protein [Pontibacter sp. HSC-14F20]
MAQAKLSLEPRAGYGTFRMEAMKEYQQTLSYASDVNAQAVNSFNPHYHFGLGVVYALSERIHTGVFGELGETGGRVHYEDYSGELRHDLRVKYKSVGILVSSQFPIGATRFGFVTGLEASVILSKLHAEEYTRLYERTDENEKQYNATGFGIKPYAGLLCRIGNIPVQLTTGYMASASGPFHTSGNPNFKLDRNSKNDKLEPGWSGLRLNLSISVPIIKYKKQ